MELNKKIDDLKKESLIELRIIAKNLGVKSSTTYKKSDLIEKIAEMFDKREDIVEKNDTSSDSDLDKQMNKTVTYKQNTDDQMADQQNNRRSDNRYDNRQDGRSDNRYDSKQDNRSDNRYDSRQDNRDEKKLLYTTPPEMTDENKVEGILEILPDGFGFLRGSNYLSTENDIYVSPNQIRKLWLKTGDYITGVAKPENPNEKFRGMMFIHLVNGDNPSVARARTPFEQLTPIYPDKKLRLESENSGLSSRIVDLFSPIGMGQRGLIVAPPKVGKTMLLKEIANSISENYPDVTLIILLIDERPEEVTDMMESIDGEVIYSTFDQASSHHVKVAEMVLGRAQRLVEHGKDVVILLDSITRLARAYNLTINPTGRTLSGGLDPGALHGPKKFFGAARNIRGGGSLTILGTALVDTGSKMDDIIFEEFKGTGNMELCLDRNMAEKRIFPAIDIYKSSTRREDLLLSKEEMDSLYKLRRSLDSKNSQLATDQVIEEMKKTKSNKEFLDMIKQIHFR